MARRRLKRRVLKHVWTVRLGLVVVAALFLYALFTVTPLVFDRTGAVNYARAFTNFVFTPAGAIEASMGKTNILILGKGGRGHDAPDLTDTVMFVALDHETYSIATISVPRDIWIAGLRTKLNSIYYWGNQKMPGGGLTLSKSTVEEIVGQPIHYALVVDFSIFQQLIDVLGGIEVEVEREFTDEKYPIAGKQDDECEGDPEFGCRYTVVSFKQGVTTMDGATALTFVRSRNAEGVEGTDLARSVRQQKVLSAIKAKALSPTIILSPRKLYSVLSIFSDSIETDIGFDVGAYLARMALASKGGINSHIVPEELLFNPAPLSRYDNLYVFIPKAENWAEVHDWVKEALAR